MSAPVPLQARFRRYDRFDLVVLSVLLLSFVVAGAGLVLSAHPRPDVQTADLFALVFSR